MIAARVVLFVRALAPPQPCAVVFKGLGFWDIWVFWIFELRVFGFRVEEV